MRIAVFGASGKTGRLAVSEGVRRGHAVVATVRPETADRVTFDPVVEVRTCDVYADRGVSEAVSGCDAVVSCIGIRRRNPLNPWSPLRSPADTAARTTRNILDAMDAEGTARIACISAAGVGESIARVALPLRVLIGHSNLRPAYQDLLRMEEALDESGTHWVALRPTTLTNARRASVVRVTDRYRVTSRVSRGAVARALIDFADGSWDGPGGRVMVTGASGRASPGQPTTIWHARGHDEF